MLRVSRSRRAIADIQAQIAKIKQRAARQKVQKDPSLRHLAAAVRSIDKALSASKDPVGRKALDEARTSLIACMALNGVKAGSRAGSKPMLAAVEESEILAYVKDHPGSKCEDIAGGLRVDPKAVSPVLKGLRTEGKVRAEGRARGMRYEVEG